ncbi:MAG TPA: hypothetical protein VK483_09445 [Chitinophagaceae bacterium]|nr:hypothetical protein [Chitinophagaceae bacterium]
MNLNTQIIWLFLLAIPVACVSWAFTHEELFREPREYCVNRSLHDKTLLKRKFFFIFTCEYCLSHYMTIIFLILTDYKLLLNDWRGYIIAGFSIVWIANIYMSIFALIRQNIKKEITEIKVLEKEAKT